MQQKDKIGAPTPGAAAEQGSSGPDGSAKDDGVIRPRCMSAQCVARREAGEKRPDNSPIGDPMKLWRLRYDFPDGVVAETLFCGDCRAIVNATLVGVDAEILKRKNAVIPEPPKA